MPLAVLPFVFSKFIATFVATNQIFLPFKGVWFLLRRVERLGSVKPWQPIPAIREKGAKT
jgi:hypothetical protein